MPAHLDPGALCKCTLCKCTPARPPAHSKFTAAAIGQQRLWILREEGSVRGVVVLSLSPECRRYIAACMACPQPYRTHARSNCSAEHCRHACMHACMNIMTCSDLVLGIVMTDAFSQLRAGSANFSSSLVTLQTLVVYATAESRAYR
eukprot:1140092-Pelagomonas_calceolata.AAC.3